MKSNNVYWRTKEGDVINVDDMSESHVRNCLKLIIRGRKVKTEVEIVGRIESLFAEEKMDHLNNELEDDLSWGNWPC